MLKYPPEFWDDKGQLRLPLSYWLILLLQSRSWVLLVLAGVSRQQASTLLGLFYPDPHDFWFGLIGGIPAVAGFLLSGWRQRFPRSWQAWRWVLIFSLLFSFIQPSVAISQDRVQMTPWLIITGVADLLALCWLLLDGRLRDCFNPHLMQAE
ncbi:hypothetical protein BL250_03425 [Erwinia sp. OLTSP20]|uniref:DUF2919 domain-containing protein n=1 Tax=unclassified Erwinia TaxID=2622719 RepID=UPI000C18CCD1|nr:MULTISPECIES: DUF2919 domain-containing protein [unclassified Erwinia]PIJ51565.1 hypothetical protein BV501_03820 [Erwinia sp. OAMSP11]PIJ75849.1 hypothetical protein BK416_00435 [Erwinia sp. OLSSP12]PIJ83475.1 hypothetical protein BLD47_04815 [Erwinia sp. OLCASP19]PIJ86308.1 hypothetical protein BLD46_04245 [Erwinia sp. OLMTSP26]PIJ88449.1 hypothetical protein BLD49_01625 [Erwinia sp. OLMDSP33]